MGKEMTHEILLIEGMTCINCQNRIEGKLKNTQGISFVRVSFQKAQAEISFDKTRISHDEIVWIIRELGYDAKDENQKTTDKWIKNAGIIALIVVLYILLQEFGILNMLVPSELADSKMGYGALFVVGLLTSVHCIAMCGGINLSQSIPSSEPEKSKSKLMTAPLLYNAGRVISYTTAGFLLGGLGMILSGVSGEGVPLVIQGLLKIAAGLFMVIMGANMLGLSAWLRKFHLALPKKAVQKISKISLKQKRPFVIGLLNVFMPCGPMQSMQIVALGSGNPLAGALSMFMFSLGTVPLMIGLGSFVALLGKKYARAVMGTGSVLLVVLGLAMFTQGTNLADINLNLFSTLPQKTALFSQAEETETLLDKAVISEDGSVQYVESELDFGNYPEITVYEGIPVKWTIRVSEEVINGCNYKMILNDYGIIHEFTPGENVIEFTPQKAGSGFYTCWMGMIYGKINVLSSKKSNGGKNEG
ncbi:MAG: sulfite exporter TauE/SafE family protein [Treponema sp.]|uniref:urease accessory protein UreH domain-containing protein n=1 Tax=Treponema sp. TaxID=166 RepID=UPI0025EB2BBC|nr:sulfite exporter TauE/SafE family protein [Treponema sp.]MBQ9283324.1 sulfite exporter TauE/SafE family protein [Treponema sp.]